MLSTEFLGRLHPLIVHLPIGILLFAFAMIILKHFRQTQLDSAISWALMLGFISATLACLAGWFLAQSGEYKADLVFKHQWAGISTAVLSFAAYFFKRFQTILTTTTVVILVIAAHYGGSLTHGEDYLFPKKKAKPNIVVIKPNTENKNLNENIGFTEPTKTKEVLKVEKKQAVTHKTFIYRDMIVPILEAKCYKCHSEIKMKGGLRLDSEVFIQEGGKHGGILSKGDAENSKFFNYLVLPEDDDNHMPPKGKPQLTEQEISTIYYWIKNGASFIEATSNEPLASSPARDWQLTAHGSQLKVKDSSKTRQFAPAIASENYPSMEAKILSDNIEAAQMSLLEKLRQENIIISTFGTGSNYLMANFVNVKNYSFSLIDDLKGVKNQLLRLRLSNQPVSDSDLKKISAFKNLTRLNIEKSSITDAGLVYLQNLPNLEQLNLYGTNITDSGLENLTHCNKLKVVYLWQTKITISGIERLKKAAPNLQIEGGNFSFSTPDTNKIKKELKGEK